MFPHGLLSTPRGLPGIPKGPAMASQGFPRAAQATLTDPLRAPETPQEPQRPTKAPPKGSQEPRAAQKTPKGGAGEGGCAQNMHIPMVFRVVFVCYRFRPGLTCPLGAAQTDIERFVIVIH